MRNGNEFVSTKLIVLSDDQYGFRHNGSTIFALIKLDELIKSFLDRILTIISTFIDLREAFNTLNHNILIKRDENMGFGVLYETGRKVISVIDSNV